MAAHVSSPVVAGKAAKFDRRRRKVVVILKLVIVVSFLSSRVNANTIFLCENPRFEYFYREIF
jgi:hypothetical protein